MFGWSCKVDTRGDERESVGDATKRVHTLKLECGFTLHKGQATLRLSQPHRMIACNFRSQDFAAQDIIDRIGTGKQPGRRQQLHQTHHVLGP